MCVLFFLFYLYFCYASRPRLFRIVSFGFHTVNLSLLGMCVSLPAFGICARLCVCVFSTSLLLGITVTSLVCIHWVIWNSFHYLSIKKTIANIAAMGCNTYSHTNFVSYKFSLHENWFSFWMRLYVCVCVCICRSMNVFWPLSLCTLGIFSLLLLSISFLHTLFPLSCFILQLLLLFSFFLTVCPRWSILFYTFIRSFVR